ncbi:MAG TPA: hypothetical protein VHN14_17000 [Kofleriaceae bacterium]|nr:hypothetical protein [Kofleriaceae bacterium]
MAWLVLGVSLAGCTMQSFEYQATVTFSPAAGTVRLNHQPIPPGAVWAASYSSFEDALRDPSIVEVGEKTMQIGPDACRTACAACTFDRASLSFQFDGDRVAVEGTCDAGNQRFAVHVAE